MLRFVKLYWLNDSITLRQIFSLHLFSIFSLSIINALYGSDPYGHNFLNSFGLWNPMCLLLGPALYFSHRSLKGETISTVQLVHLFPFIFMSLFYVYIAAIGDFSGAVFTVATYWYQSLYLLVAFSMFGYASHSLLGVFHSGKADSPDASLLIVSLSVVYLLLGLVIFLMFICSLAWVQIGFDLKYLSYGLLGSMSLMVGLYWLFGDKDVQSHEAEEKTSLPRAASALSDELALDYIERIKSYFESNHMFLNPNINIDLLSSELSIPKHDFATLFSVYFGKRFHDFIAEYRINHAVKLLNEKSENLKIESLAASCGFNSKAAFFKHFKDKTGLTPAEYRDNRFVRSA